MDKRQIELIGAGIGCCGYVAGSELAATEFEKILKLNNSTYKFKDILTYKYDKENIQELQNFYTQLGQECKQVLAKNNFPVVIGGDHSHAIGTWNGVADYLIQHKLAEVGLIWLDAHFDSHTPESSQSGNLHGMPVAHLLGKGFSNLIKLFDIYPALKPENLVMIGQTSFEAAEAELIKNLGVRVHYLRDLNASNTTQIIVDEFNYLATRTGGVGISLDLDGMHCDEIKGTGMMEAGGIKINQLFKAFEQIDITKLIALEISEYNPILDKDLSTYQFIYELINHINYKLGNNNA